MKGVKELSEFIDRAVKSRKYQEGTAQGIRSALKLFERELNEDELASLDLFKERFESIYKSVCSSNARNFTAGSLETYRKRVSKLISDYEKYGIDPTKMSSWNVKAPLVRVKKTNDVSTGRSTEESAPPLPAPSSMSDRIELSLRDDSKAILILPRGLTKAEAFKIKTILDSLITE